MCQCTPSRRTPFCGKGSCQWPEDNKQAAPPGLDSMLKQHSPTLAGQEKAFEQRLVGLAHEQVQKIALDHTRRQEAMLAQLVVEAARLWPALDFRVVSRFNAVDMRHEYWVERRLE